MLDQADEKSVYWFLLKWDTEYSKNEEYKRKVRKTVKQPWGNDIQIMLSDPSVLSRLEKILDLREEAEKVTNCMDTSPYSDAFATT